MGNAPLDSLWLPTDRLIVEAAPGFEPGITVLQGERMTVINLFRLDYLLSGINAV
jgi:hypothetical protein